MRKVLSLLFLALVVAFSCAASGCKQERKSPVVKVERVERSGTASLKITYENHSSNNGTPYVDLHGPEEVRAYKQQLQFLLSQIEEAEKRMDQNEQK